jgi:hypothetical protein
LLYIDRERHDKSIMIGSIIAALFLLYMIKPAPANASCNGWGEDLDNRFMNLDSQFSSNPSEEVANAGMTL